MKIILIVLSMVTVIFVGATSSFAYDSTVWDYSIDTSGTMIKQDFIDAGYDIIFDDELRYNVSVADDLVIAYDNVNHDYYLLFTANDGIQATTSINVYDGTDTTILLLESGQTDELVYGDVLIFDLKKVVELDLTFKYSSTTLENVTLEYEQEISQSMVGAILSTFTGIIAGIGVGIVGLFESLILNDTEDGLSTFGLWTFAILGISFAILIFNRLLNRFT